MRRSNSMRRSVSSQFYKKGALLLRFTRSDLVKKVLCAPLASSALRLIVTQSTLDNLFCESISACQPAVRKRYEVIHDMRRRLNNSALPQNAADLKYSIGKQWWRAHTSFRDLLRPGQEQRAMNAIRLATQEQEQMDELRVHESELEHLQCVGTPLSHSASGESLSGGQSSTAMSSSAQDPMMRVSRSGNDLALVEEELSRQVSPEHRFSRLEVKN